MLNRFSRYIPICLLALFPLATTGLGQGTACDDGCVNTKVEGVDDWYADLPGNWYMAVRVVITVKSGICLSNGGPGECIATSPCKPAFSTQYQATVTGCDMTQEDGAGVVFWDRYNAPTTSGDWATAWRREDNQNCTDSEITVTAKLTSPSGGQTVTCSTTSKCSQCGEK